MDKVKYFLNNIERYIVYVFFTILLALMFIQVVARYIFSTAWGWMEIVTRVMFIWISFAGISWACKADGHLRVTALAEFQKNRKMKLTLLLIGEVLMAIVCGYLCVLVYNMMIQCIISGQVFTGASFLKVWVMYLAGVLGLGGASIRVIQFGIIPKIKAVLSRREEEAGAAREEETASGGGN